MTLINCAQLKNNAQLERLFRDVNNKNMPINNMIVALDENGKPTTSTARPDKKDPTTAPMEKNAQNIPQAFPRSTLVDASATMQLIDGKTKVNTTP